jgi:Zn-finger nucleic acid-binding protein
MKPGRRREDLACPSCASSTLRATTLEPGLAAHTCGQWSGAWIDAEAYRGWLERRRAQPDVAEPPAAPLALADVQHARLCPSCGRVMLRYRVGHGVDFFLDTCGMCNGIWLDRDEWAALKARNLHDDLHLIFTEPWQAEVHRAAARAHLEPLYRKRFGAAFDEAVRVRAWLEAHPERAAILAFLADPEPFEP